MKSNLLILAAVFLVFALVILIALKVNVANSNITQQNSLPEKSFVTTPLPGATPSSAIPTSSDLEIVATANDSSPYDESTPVAETVAQPVTPKVVYTPEPKPLYTPSVVTTPKPVVIEPEVITVPETPFKPLSWGVFAGSNTGTIMDFENRVAVNPDYLAYFVHWGNGDGELPSFLKTYAANKDRTLVVFWEASDYLIGGTVQPDFAYRNILEGNWDDYFVDFAQQLEDYGGPIILIPFSEMNGNWTPWSGTTNGNTPEEAKEAFRYVHGYFDNLSNVKIGWAVNSASVPNTQENQIWNYYPGDAYVDIVGVDGFNKGDPWLSFDEIFRKPLTTLSAYNKPTFIFSFASAPSAQKASWLEDAFYEQMPKYPLLTSWIYFNQNKERNWLLWSDKDTFEVFTDYIEED